MTRNIGLNDYKGTIDNIDEATLEFAAQQIKALLPPEHCNFSTLIYLLERVVAKALLNSDGQSNINQAADQFCENVKIIGQNAIIIDSPTQ